MVPVSSSGATGRELREKFHKCPLRNVVPIGGSFAASMAGSGGGQRSLGVPGSHLPASS